LFVINLGIALGAGLYEHRIVVPRWIEQQGAEAHWNGETARRDDTGRRFWALVSTLPLTLLTVVSLILAWRAPEGIRLWWLAATFIALAERLLTFGYFIPTMVSLLEAADSPESVAVAARWANLNHLRHALILSAWLAALKTLATCHGQPR
jgi:hypothetical protein